MNNEENKNEDVDGVKEEEKDEEKEENKEKKAESEKDEENSHPQSHDILHPPHFNGGVLGNKKILLAIGAVTLVIITAILFFVISSISSNPAQKSFENFTKNPPAEYTITVSDEGGVAPFSLSIKGMSDKNNQRSQLSMKLFLIDPQNPYATMDMISTKENMYIRIGDIESSIMPLPIGTMDGLDSFLPQISNKWIKINMKEPFNEQEIQSLLEKTGAGDQQINVQMITNELNNSLEPYLGTLNQYDSLASAISQHNYSQYSIFSSATKVGEDSINDKQLTKYNVDINEEEIRRMIIDMISVIAENIGEIGEQDIQEIIREIEGADIETESLSEEIDITVSIDKEEMLPYIISIKPKNETMQFSVMMDKYNQSVDIQEPAEYIGIAKLMESLLSTQQSINTGNDARKITNIRAMQTALLQHKIITGSYPVGHKSRAGTCIRVSYDTELRNSLSEYVPYFDWDNASEYIYGTNSTNNPTEYVLGVTLADKGQNVLNIDVDNKDLIKVPWNECNCGGPSNDSVYCISSMKQ